MRFVVVVLLSAFLALGACTNEPSADEVARPTASMASEPASLPRQVTCPDGTAPVTGVFDSAGHQRFTSFLTAWSKSSGRPVVDVDDQRVFFLREDGTAHTAVTWMDGPGRGRIFPDTMEQCPDHREWREVIAASSEVALQVGHCWVEPVEVDGRTWDVIAEDQFGWGGPTPRGLAPRRGITTEFVLDGKLTIAGDVAIYVDASGGRLTLVPEGAPWALNRGGCD